jgi:hypothetical protein
MDRSLISVPQIDLFPFPVPRVGNRGTVRCDRRLVPMFREQVGTAGTGTEPGTNDTSPRRSNAPQRSAGGLSEGCRYICRPSRHAGPTRMNTRAGTQPQTRSAHDQTSACDTSDCHSRERGSTSMFIGRSACGDSIECEWVCEPIGNFACISGRSLTGSARGAASRCRQFGAVFGLKVAAKSTN